MRPITNTSKNFYVTINVLKLLTSLTGLSALSTFGDSESEIGSSSYTCQYKLFIRFKDYSYNNVVQYIIHNIINQHYILDALGTHKETRKTKEKLEGQLELFHKMPAMCHPEHGPVEVSGEGLCRTMDIQQLKLNALGTHKEPRKTKDKLDGQLELFHKMPAMCHPKHGPVEVIGEGLCRTMDIQQLKLKLN